MLMSWHTVIHTSFTSCYQEIEVKTFTLQILFQLFQLLGKLQDNVVFSGLSLLPLMWLLFPLQCYTFYHLCPHLVNTWQAHFEYMTVMSFAHCLLTQSFIGTQKHSYCWGKMHNIFCTKFFGNCISFICRFCHTSFGSRDANFLQQFCTQVFM